jgi:hypothetical protein
MYVLGWRWVHGACMHVVGCGVCVVAYVHTWGVFWKHVCIYVWVSLVGCVFVYIDVMCVRACMYVLGVVGWGGTCRGARLYVMMWCMWVLVCMVGV